MSVRALGIADFILLIGWGAVTIWGVYMWCDSAGGAAIAVTGSVFGMQLHRILDSANGTKPQPTIPSPEERQNKEPKP